MLINVLVGGNNLTAIMSLKRSSERGVISGISGKQKKERPEPQLVMMSVRKRGAFEKWLEIITGSISFFC